MIRLLRMAHDLEDLVARFEPSLRRLAMGMLRDPGAAADTVQEVFIAAWRQEGSPDAVRDPGAWLATLCLNRCRNVLRGRGRERRRLEAVGRETPAVAHPDPGAEQRESCDRILAEVARLPQREQEAFLLMGVEGHSSARAAEIMGCAPGAARMALMRARLALAERLGGANPGDGPAGPGVP